MPLRINEPAHSSSIHRDENLIRLIADSSPVVADQKKADRKLVERPFSGFGHTDAAVGEAERKKSLGLTWRIGYVLG